MNLGLDLNLTSRGRENLVHIESEYISHQRIYVQMRKLF